jgi:uncharacterized protein
MTLGFDPANLIAWRGLLWSWDAWVLTVTLTVVVPMLGYRRFRHMLALGDHVVPRRRKLTFYGRVVGVQWFLVAVMLLILRHHGLSAGDAGERLGEARVTLIVTAVLLLVLAVVSGIVLWRMRRAQPAALGRSGGRLRSVMPTSGVEMAAFAVVCLTAGVCEELLYRGWLVTILRVATGSTWGAVVVGSVVFGIGHAYQGGKGVLRTALVGLQLAILFVLLGSLIPGQVLHVGVDLLAGAAGALAVSRLSIAESKQGTGGSAADAGTSA